MIYDRAVVYMTIIIKLNDRKKNYIYLYKLSAIKGNLKLFLKFFDNYV